MSTILIWLSGHRGLIIALIAVSLWGTAYYLYFGRRVLIPYLRRGDAHSWRVDMANKKAVARGREQVR